MWARTRASIGSLAEAETPLQPTCPEAHKRKKREENSEPSLEYLIESFAATPFS